MTTTCTRFFCQDEAVTNTLCAFHFKQAKEIFND